MFLNINKLLELKLKSSAITICKYVLDSLSGICTVMLLEEDWSL